MASVVKSVSQNSSMPIIHERVCLTMAAPVTVCTYMSACDAGLGQDILLAVCGGRWLQ